MHSWALLLALTVVAMACSPGPESGTSPSPSDQRTVEPSSTVAPPTPPAPSPTPTATVAPPTIAPPAATAAGPTPVARTITGRATLVATGAPVAGVRVRGMPMPLNDGRAPGPDVTAMTDVDGAYTFSVLTWTLETLAASSSFQLMLDITPPAGFLVVEVPKSLGSPVGSGVTGPRILGDLNGPIDITLGPGHVVEGKVTSGLTGAPLAEIRVIALGLNSILINGGQGDAFEVEAMASTDTSGRYSLTVRPGTYVIAAVEPQGAAQRFWSDDPAIFQATPLKVERPLAGIDVVLVPVTAVGRQVRSGPTFVEGVEGVRVVAYLAGGTACCRIVGVATTGPLGTFVMYVPQGVYRIVFEPPAGSPYASQWWNGAAGFATATDVTVGSARVQLEVELTRVSR